MEATSQGGKSSKLAWLRDAIGQAYLVGFTGLGDTSFFTRAAREERKDALAALTRSLERLLKACKVGAVQ